MLHVVVGTEGKAFLMAALGIQPDEVAGDVLDALLGALLHALPGSGAQRTEPWRFVGRRPAVLGYLVERMDGDIHGVAALIDDADHLLVTLARGHPDQTGEFADAEIDMHDEVTGLHLLQLLHRERHLSGTGGVGSEAVFVETVKNLMVGKQAHTCQIVGEPGMKGLVDIREGDLLLLIDLLVGCQDVAQALDLLRAVGEHIEAVSPLQVVGHGVTQQGEILLEDGLRRDIKPDGGFRHASGFVADLYSLETADALGEIAGTHQLALAAELFARLLTLHLGQVLEAFGDGLLGETLAVDPADGIGHISQVAHDDRSAGARSPPVPSSPATTASGCQRCGWCRSHRRRNRCGTDIRNCRNRHR